ncbi:MAG: hypothetical protein ACEY3J_03960 [Arsenophonus sp.]
MEDNSRIKNLNVNIKLNNGMLSFSNLLVSSVAMNIDGNAWLNLERKSADMELLIKINKGCYRNAILFINLKN